MWTRISHLWHNNRFALIAFVLAVVVLGMFTVRTVVATIYWMDPAHRDQALAGWMTPRYVARSYGLPPEVLGPALFLEKDTAPKRRSLDAIAADNGVTLAALQSRIDAAVAVWREEHESKRP